MEGEKGGKMEKKEKEKERGEIGGGEDIENTFHHILSGFFSMEIYFTILRK